MVMTMVMEKRSSEEEHTYQYLLLLFFLRLCLHPVLFDPLLHPLIKSTALFTETMSRLCNGLPVVKTPRCSPFALANCEAFISSSTLQLPAATLLVYWPGLPDVIVRQVSTVDNFTKRV